MNARRVGRGPRACAFPLRAAERVTFGASLACSLAISLWLPVALAGGWTPAAVGSGWVVEAPTVAPPSLLRPGLLDPLDEGSDAASVERRDAGHRPLAEWVSSIAEERGSVAAPERRTPNPEAQAKAVRLYVQGRAAALEGRTLIAAQRFTEALQLDPDAPEILSAHARVLVRLGNGTLANQIYERLLALDPDRPEALVTLGLQAAERGDAKATVLSLGRLLADPDTLSSQRREQQEEFWASLRPDAVLAVELSLIRALAEIGADAALVDLVDSCFARGEPQLSGPPASECRRLAGDARARRGDIAGALADWRSAMSELERNPAPAPDAAIAPLAARLLWAEVSLGTTALTTFRRLVDLLGPTEEVIALAAWLAAVPVQPEPDGSSHVSGRNDESERRSFATTVEVRVGEPRSARLAAALAPSRAVERLAASHDRRRPDRAHVAAWLAAAASQDRSRAIDTAVNLLDDAVAEPDMVIDGLLDSGLDAPELLRLSAPRAGEGASPRRIALHMRLLVALGRTADAWDLGLAWRAESADPTRPLPWGGGKRHDPAVLRAAIAVAIAAKKNEAIPALAALVAKDDVGGQIELVRAWGLMGDVRRARAAAELAVAASSGESGASRVPNRRAAAVARSLLAAATAAAAARDRDADRVSESLGELRIAVAEDPAYETSWTQLLNVTRIVAKPEGGRGQRTVSAEEAELRKELIEAIPDSSAAFALRREELMTQGRSGDALEALVARAMSASWDEALLRDAVTALTLVDRDEEALGLLESSIAQAPGRPSTWQLWAEISIAQGRAEDVLDRLTARIERDDPDPIAQSLLSMPLRALKRDAEADAADDAQLARQATSVRQEIAKVARAIDAGDQTRATSGLESLSASIDSLGDPECFAGLELALRLRGEAAEASRRRDTLIRAFAEAVLARAERPAEESAVVLDSAAIVRAAGALALVERDAEARRSLARRALTAVQRESRPFDRQAASVWLDLAQRFADRKQCAEGSEFLGTLVASDVRLAPDVAGRLATACFALDAAAGGRAKESVALLDLVRSRGVRPFAGRDRAVDRDSDELTLLAGVYSLVNDREGSNAILRAALERDPNHPMAKNNLGWDALDHQGPTEEAIAFIEAAHAASPNDASILDSMAWLRFRQGKLDEAADLIAKAIEAARGDPSVEVLDHAGDIALARGDTARAIAAWEEILTIVAGPSSKETIVGRLPTYELNEHGVSVIDAEALWQRNYGVVAERARQKLAERAQVQPSGASRE